MHLPIFDIRHQLRDALAGTRRLVLQAPTGSGKSTQVPQMLRDEGCVPPEETILVLQPRRVATRALARRIAEERNEKLGGEVGYQIRFDRVASAETRILFITEALLQRRMLSDPELKGVGAVLFDEFHERHLATDLGLSLVHQLQQTRRPDLALVVMSATLNTAQVADFLEPCAVLEVSGRAFPVEVSYSGRGGGKETWDLAAEQFRQSFRGSSGDFLVFMPGAYEIRKTIEAIENTPEGRACTVLPLYGDLSPDQQDAALAPGTPEQRKVVVATNVAETSLTIPGVRVVIDSGLARIARYDPHRMMNTLLIEKISIASAEQRAGRAGRTAPGQCLRLWAEKEHEHRPAQEEPEIRRVELSATLLELAAMGVRDFAAFSWFEAPTDESRQRAENLLVDLGALWRGDDGLALTEVGQRMAAFPLEPRFARMFLEASALGCLPAVALVAALSQEKDILLPLRDKRAAEEREELLGEVTSDFLLRLRAWQMARAKKFDQRFCRKLGIHAQTARRVERLWQQFLQIGERQGLQIKRQPAADDESVCRCLLLGFVDQLAKRDDRGTLRCRLLHSRRGELRRDSAVRDADLLVVAEIDEVEQRGEVNILLSMATAIDEAWLEEYFPKAFKEHIETVLDLKQKRVVGRRQRCFHDLVLEQSDNAEPEPGIAAKLLAQAVREGRIELKMWDERIEAWIARVNFAAAQCPELAIVPIDDEARALIVEQICEGATSARDLRERDPWSACRSWLSHEQLAALEQMVPASLELPRRRKPVAIRYESPEKAVLASKLQDFYDVEPSRLTICGERYPLVLELLAPNGRPAQVTTDLASFWQNSYPEVKKQLKGRYPKHEWR